MLKVINNKANIKVTGSMTATKGNLQINDYLTLNVSEASDLTSHVGSVNLHSTAVSLTYVPAQTPVYSTIRFTAAHNVEVTNALVLMGYGNASFRGDSDSDRYGSVNILQSLTIGSGAIEQLFVTAANVELGSTVQAMAANVFFQTSGADGHVMRLGGTPQSPLDFHLAVAEIRRIYTAGVLTFGGNMTDHVRVSDLEPLYSVSNMVIKAMKRGSSTLTFEGVRNQFVQPLLIKCLGSIYVDAPVTSVAKTDMFADDECNRVGSLVVSDGGSFQVTSNFTIRASDMDANGTVYSDTRLDISVCHGDNIALGGDGTANAQMVLQRSDLENIGGRADTVVTTQFGVISVHETRYSEVSTSWTEALCLTRCTCR